MAGALELAGITQAIDRVSAALGRRRIALSSVEVPAGEDVSAQSVESALDVRIEVDDVLIQMPPHALSFLWSLDKG